MHPSSSIRILLSTAILATASISTQAQTNRVMAPITPPAVLSGSRTTTPKRVAFEAPRPGEVVVSDRDFNRFIFSAPVVQLVFPAGAPILGKPIYLSGNTQVLLQMQRGIDTPTQLVAEVEGGHVYTLTLIPRPVDGITERIGNATERKAVAGNSRNELTSREEDVNVLKRIVIGDIPSGFDPATLPSPTRFDKFTVVPLASWADGMWRRVTVFSLVAAQDSTAVVAPPQFYREGITAIMIDGDVVDANNSPNLFVVEELTNE